MRMFNLLFTYIKFDYEHLDECVSKKINITFWVGYIVGMGVLEIILDVSINKILKLTMY